MSRSCNHIHPREQRPGFVCAECLLSRVATEPNHSHPVLASGLAVLEARLAELRLRYPDWQFRIANPDPSMTPGEAEHIAAQIEDCARRAHEAAPDELPRSVKLRALAQLEDLRLQEKARRLQAAEATLSRGEAAVAEHWIAIQQREKTFAAQELRLAQRTDWTVLGVAAVSLLATFGPPPTVEARFLATLLVASVTAWWFGGRHWLGGDLDAFQASPVGCGWTVLRALAGRVVGATRRSSAAAGSGR